MQMQVMQELWSPRLDASHVMSPRVRFPIQVCISKQSYLILYAIICYPKHLQ